VLLDVVHHPPLASELPRSRWWLDGLRQAIPWLAPLSLSGVWRLLRRLDVVYKRGQESVYSPDPDYDAKLAAIAAARQEAQADPRRVVFLYQDEMTYYRQPTVSQGYARRGSIGPRAWRHPGSNPGRRVAACLNVVTGQLHTCQRAHFRIPALRHFFTEVAAAYPDADRIYIALDNWPVHFNPALLETLPASITLLRLPTYASWTNPVEKVWRYLRQEVIHLHPHATEWLRMWERVEDWLAHWHRPSPALLHYVGLAPIK
jgi:DDE superfamily endonuclease